MHSPKFGVVLPDGHEFPALLDFARDAEAAGFDSVWAGESLYGLDPLVVLAGAAAVTSRIGLGTAALNGVFRHPVIGANLVATLDHACEGRLTLAVGTGFPGPATEQELAAVRVPFDERAGRLDETVTMWRQAWRAGGTGTCAANVTPPENADANFAGQYWQTEGLDRLPPPAQDGGPRLWLADNGDPDVPARAAGHYDGWLASPPDPHAFADRCRQIGTVVPALYATVAINADPALARQELAEHFGGDIPGDQAVHSGTAEECAAWLARYSDARHVLIRIGSPDPASRLKELAAAVRTAIDPR